MINIKTVTFTDIFSLRVWRNKERSFANNETLRQLSRELPNVLLQSRSINTRKSYNVQFKKWIRWCKEHSIHTVFPANDFHVALFLTHLIQSGSSISVIEAVFYSLKWSHDIVGVNSPCDTNLVRFTLDAAKKLCSAPAQKKKPISAEIIANMFASYNLDTISLYHIRTLAMIVIGFSGFLRIGELLNLKCSDVTFQGDYLSLYIRSSKTDQTRRGSSVIIAKSSSDTCPYKTLQLYFSKAGLSTESENYVFRAVSFCKNAKVFKLKKDGNLSYTRARELLHEKLVEVGLNPKEYGTHSLRRGGATASAVNNVCDRLFKKHGRWKSDHAKDGYVSEDLNSILSVSQNLGL